MPVVTASAAIFLIRPCAGLNLWHASDKLASSLPVPQARGLTGIPVTGEDALDNL